MEKYITDERTELKYELVGAAAEGSGVVVSLSVEQLPCMETDFFEGIS